MCETIGSRHQVYDAANDYQVTYHWYYINWHKGSEGLRPSFCTWYWSHVPTHQLVIFELLPAVPTDQLASRHAWIEYERPICFPSVFRASMPCLGIISARIETYFSKGCVEVSVENLF
jgi:hypothetical protein